MWAEEDETRARDTLDRLARFMHMHACEHACEMRAHTHARRVAHDGMTWTQGWHAHGDNDGGGDRRGRQGGGEGGGDEGGSARCARSRAARARARWVRRSDGRRHEGRERSRLGGSNLLACAVHVFKGTCCLHNADYMNMHMKNKMSRSSLSSGVRWCADVAGTIRGAVRVS